MKKLTYNLENSKQSVARIENKQSQSNPDIQNRQYPVEKIPQKCQNKLQMHVKENITIKPRNPNPKISTDKPINKNPKLNQFKVKYFEKNQNTMWGFQKNL